MSWLDKLLNGVCNPKKGQKPIFHNIIPQIYNPDYNYQSYILSGYPKIGWFNLSDKPLTKEMLIFPDIIIQLTGRYVEYGAGFAIELKEEQSFIPSEWVGLRVRFI